jgi:multidrug efflux pump subunit AcrB
MLRTLVAASLDGAIPILVIIVALGAGTFSLLETPREEEPQIVVPMADVLIDAPTLNAREVERLVATPLEKLLAQIEGVEHIYSVSDDGGATVTVRFFVGEDREDSLVKLYNKLFSNEDLVPAAVTSWVVKPLEVDDVPIVVATLWSDADGIDDHLLRRIAEEVALSMQAIPDTNRIEVIGGRPREFRVDLDPTALAGRDTAIADVLFALSASNVRSPAGSLQRMNTDVPLETNGLIASVDELKRMTVNVVDGIAVRMSDVARVSDAPAEPESYTWIAFGPAHEQTSPLRHPAASIAVAKKKGTNAVDVAREVEDHLERAASELFPPGVHFEIIRDYGETANRKIRDLVSSLGVAVATVVILIGLVLGWRAALVVALAVPVCYGITLALDYASGYTINRVTLFALILALGLLVDDPITGVDNMERHIRSDRALRDQIVDAFMEIRMPLVMSTVAIVIAFAPMSFITGMMGPYMSPMAFNVPVAVISSTLVAFVVTPWAGKWLLRPGGESGRSPDSAFQRAYRTLLRPLLERRSLGLGFLGVVAVMFILALVLPLLRAVPLKLLPYDNKNEFQVVIEAPEGTTLEGTDAAAARIAAHLQGVPEVRAVAGYVGTHSPMDFNGMVRHYYLRGRPHEAELRVTLVPKENRRAQSHALILRVRPEVERIARESGVIAKLVEVPPGPPVISTLVAEHYGTATTPYETLITAAKATAQRLRREPGIVDVDVSAAATAKKLVFLPDQEKAALSGISNAAIADAVQVMVEGRVAGHADVPDEASPLPIVLRVPYEARSDIGNLRIKGMPGIGKIRERGAVRDAPTPIASVAELGKFQNVLRDQPIFHKDLRRVAYTFADVAGRAPADIIFDVDRDRMRPPAEVRPVANRTFLSPGGGEAWRLPSDVRLSWSGEGEWDVTLRVFRDLGIAFGVAVLGIFLVIRLQTGLSTLTVIIMLAIPLTAIGIMPGFWLLNRVAAGSVGEYADPVLFTATAMIGMIALAGIVVRNSLILVEFVEQARGAGAPLTEALVQSGAIRARPVLLTAGTTLLGNLVITLDPIFSGLAWAIIFGIAASTAFTLVVVPIVYQLIYGNDSRG